MILDTLITDRAAADVSRANELNRKGFASMTAAEKAEYLVGLKGAYNASDLNRVGEACEYVAERLNTIGGFDILVTAKQDWQTDGIPTPADTETYLADISAIRAAYAVIAPQTPGDMENLTFTEANDIEKILISVDELLERVIASFVYSNQTFSGIVWGAFT